MNKPFYFTLFSLILSIQLYAQAFFLNRQISESTFSDQRITQLSKQLLGFALFEKGLSQRLDSIAVSQQFIPDTLIQHTDTSLFYFRGYWKNFNPFSEEMDSVKLIIAEITRRNRVTNQVIDTLWYFQTEGSLVNRPFETTLRNTFKQLDKKISPYFSKYQYGKERKKNVWNSEWYRYYLPNSFTWTANITWQKRSSSWATVTVTFVTKLKKELSL